MCVYLCVCGCLPFISFGHPYFIWWCFWFSLVYIIICRLLLLLLLSYTRECVCVRERWESQSINKCDNMNIEHAGEQFAIRSRSHFFFVHSVSMPNVTQENNKQFDISLDSREFYICFCHLFRFIYCRYFPVCLIVIVCVCFFIFSISIYFAVYVHVWSKWFCFSYIQFGSIQKIHQ